ncbi:MAG TPA: hypothetical protein VFI82_16235, partial [Terriglobales bacterium]|nr:hypothetical protein [Terriglobales bacterium]
MFATARLLWRNWAAIHRTARKVTATSKEQASCHLRWPPVVLQDVCFLQLALFLAQEPALPAGNPWQPNRIFTG